MEHHDDDAGISFMDFLHKHYDEENSHPSPNKEHERLPFKGHDLGFSQTTITFPSLVVVEPQTDIPVLSCLNSGFSDVYYSSSILSRIWQPPKCC